MAKTAIDLAQALKGVWTSDRILEQMSGGYTTAKDIEIERALADTNKFMQRQFYTANVPGSKMYKMPLLIDDSPAATRERKVRQAEMMQRLAAKKRGNKPSYRQRQKNGRKAAGR